jgi:hypothetical protein
MAKLQQPLGPHPQAPPPRIPAVTLKSQIKQARHPYLMQVDREMPREHLVVEEEGGLPEAGRAQEGAQGVGG